MINLKYDLAIHTLLVCRQTVVYRLKYLDKKVLNINEYVAFNKIVKYIKPDEINKIGTYFFKDKTKWEEGDNRREIREQ